MQSLNGLIHQSEEKGNVKKKKSKKKQRKWTLFLLDLHLQNGTHCQNVLFVIAKITNISR